MRDFLDYKIITASSIEKLEAEVRAAMNKGWTIWGAVGTHPSETLVRGTVFTQVVVKFAPEKEN